MSLGEANEAQEKISRHARFYRLHRDEQLAKKKEEYASKPEVIARREERDKKRAERELVVQQQKHAKMLEKQRKIEAKVAVARATSQIKLEETTIIKMNEPDEKDKTYEKDTQMTSYSTLNNSPQAEAFIKDISIIKSKCKENTLSTSQPLPQRSKPYIKKHIPADMRRKLWQKYYEKGGSAPCMCCQIEEITPFTFIAGHVEAEVKGGQTILDNLRPICKRCNMRMKTHNMKEWMKVHYPYNKFQ